MNRRFAIGSMVGAVIGFAGFAWMVANGHADFFAREPLAGFFDSQARALLDGHWDVPGSEVFIEGFRIGDKTYTYFGLWPSVLRMPVLAFGDEYYGRLTQVSMLLAVAVGLSGLSALHWRIRELVRPGRDCSVAEAVVAGAVPLSFACGTTVLFLASRAWVYHEAILWGVAWSIPAYERIIAYTTAPKASRLVAASGLATLAFLSRPAAGLGPVVAIALVLGGQLLRAWRRRLVARRERRAGGGTSRPVRAMQALDWLGTADGKSSPARSVGLGIALAVPVALYCWVNFSRFGTLFQVPWRKQVLVGLNLQHQRVLDANGGTYFGLKFAPTAMLQYLRPDALGPFSLFPYVTFPRFRTPVIGDLAFDVLDWSTSVPASMPAIALLAVLGAWAVLRPSYARTRAVTVLRVPIIGAAVGVLLVLAIAFVANRYLGDWIPLLALGALAGLHVMLLRREDAERRRASSILLGTVAVLAAFGLWVNGSLALVYQRLYNPYLASSRAGMLGFQYDIDGALPGGPRALDLVDRLPEETGHIGPTIVGDCASLYFSDGRVLTAIEGTRAGGWFRFRTDPDELRLGHWMPIMSWGPRGDEDVIGVRKRGDLLHFAFGTEGRKEVMVWYQTAQPQPAPRDGVILDVHVDRALERVEARADGLNVLLLFNLRNPLEPGPFVIGRAMARGGLVPRFVGNLDPLPVRAPLCERILARRDD